jgi:choline-sulfatase
LAAKGLIVADQPNILFIVSDQMVAAMTATYGHPVVQTPSLNRLATEGVRFDAAYTPFPLCAPGRACLMTGRHASAIGAWDNGCLTTADQPTFAHYLADVGYDALLSGKMHFVGPGQLHGFPRRMTTDIYPADFTWVREEWIRIKETKGEDFEAVMADRAMYNSKGYVGDGVEIGTWHDALAYDEETHHRAISYLRAKATRDDGPFLLCASYHHPHEPFHAPQEYWDLYEGDEIEIPEFPDALDDSYSMMDQNLNAYHGTRRYNLRDPEGLRKLRRAYYGLVTYMDRNSRRAARRAGSDRTGGEHGGRVRQRPRRHVVRERDGAETMLLRAVVSRSTDREVPRWLEGGHDLRTTGVAA